MKELLISVGLTLAAAVACSAAESSKQGSEPPTREAPATLTEVAVVSDGESWVSIKDSKWQPGSGRWAENPRKFKGTELWRLPPGDYEVTARRKGFKDVRRIIQIKSSDSRVTVHAVCEVPI
jgi:hypothetical protein